MTSTARKKANQPRFLMRRFRRRPDGFWVLREQLLDADAARIFRPRLLRQQHQERHDHRARPIRNLGNVKGKPFRQQHDLDRHHRHRAPRDDAVEREQDAGEDIAIGGAAARQDRLARAPHMRFIGVITDHLEREIGFHARAHVELALMEKRPAAMLALNATQIGADLFFQRGVGFLAEIMARAERIRRGWWRRLRARTPNARPAADDKATPPRPLECGRQARGRACAGP